MIAKKLEPHVRNRFGIRGMGQVGGHFYDIAKTSTRSLEHPCQILENFSRLTCCIIGRNQYTVLISSHLTRHVKRIACSHGMVIRAGLIHALGLDNLKEFLLARHHSNPNSFNACAPPSRLEWFMPA